MSKVDKLFKDKLEGDSLQPGAQAWEKVEAHLGKKNKMVVWLRVAAAILLVGLLTVATLKSFDGYEAPKEELATKRVNAEQQPKQQQEQQQQRQPVEEKTEQPAPVAVEKTRDVKNQRPVAPVQQKVEAVAIEEQQVQQTAAVLETKTETQPAPDVAPHTSPVAHKGITLTYSLPPVKKSIAEQSPEPAVAERKTALERVLQIASEVKNSENPLGELREVKDDIFAWDFKRDKDKEKKKQTGL